MGTTFETIYNLSLITIRDYKIDKWAKQDYNTFLQYMKGILIRAIPKFTNCLQSLEYADVATNERYFINNLTYMEQSILADLMVETWFFSNINDATQINMQLQGRDKKIQSADANLKQKSEYYDRLKEKLSQSMSDYQLSGDNFTKVLGDMYG